MPRKIKAIARNRRYFASSAFFPPKRDFDKGEQEAMFLTERL
jgi:hypothetical protein